MRSDFKRTTLDRKKTGLRLQIVRCLSKPTTNATEKICKQLALSGSVISRSCILNSASVSFHVLFIARINDCVDNLNLATLTKGKCRAGNLWLLSKCPALVKEEFRRQERKEWIGTLPFLGLPHFVPSQYVQEALDASL